MNKLETYVNSDTAFYGVIKQVLYNNTLTPDQIIYMQIVEDKLIDFGMQYEQVKDNGDFVTVKISKTETLRIFSYLREINKIFKCCIRRKQVNADRWNYYIHIKKEKLLK